MNNKPRAGGGLHKLPIGSMVPPLKPELISGSRVKKPLLSPLKKSSSQSKNLFEPDAEASGSSISPPPILAPLQAGSHRAHSSHGHQAFANPSFATLDTLASSPRNASTSDAFADERKILNDVGLLRYDPPRHRPSPPPPPIILKAQRNSKGASGSTSPPAGAVAPTASTPAASDSLDSSLLSSMARRLAALEKLVSLQSADIRQRDQVIDQLLAKCHALEQAQHDENGAAQMLQLQRENKRIKQQVHEMESFLNDYGLVWVGYRNNDDAPSDEPDPETFRERAAADASDEETKEKEKEGKDKDQMWFEMKDMLLAIQDLNSSISQGKMEVVNENNIHRFKWQEEASVSLVFYKNGIFFKNGPLRPYSLPETKTFCNDILDGYFPYELKEAYPNGLLFKVSDKSNELCPSILQNLNNQLNQANQAASQAANQQGVPPPPDNAQPSTNNDTTSTPSLAAPTTAVATNPAAAPTNRPPGQVMSADEFLSKLPANVIRDGKVIPIRSEVAPLVKPNAAPANPPDVVLVETEALKLLQQHQLAASEVTTIRVKFTDAGCSLLIKLTFDDTVGMLRSHILQQRLAGEADPQQVRRVEIRTTFPAQVYDDDAMTLRQAGLIPNATLHAKLLPV